MVVNLDGYFECYGWYELRDSIHVGQPSGGQECGYFEITDLPFCDIFENVDAFNKASHYAGLRKMGMYKGRLI